MNISIDDKNRLEEKVAPETIVGKATIDKPGSAEPNVTQDVEYSAANEPLTPPYDRDNPRLFEPLETTPPSTENMWLSGSGAGAAAAVLQAIRELVNVSIEGSIKLTKPALALLQQINELGVEAAKYAQSEHDKEADRYQAQAFQEIGTAVISGMQVVAGMRADGEAQAEAETKLTGASVPNTPAAIAAGGPANIPETLKMRVDSTKAAYDTARGLTPGSVPQPRPVVNAAKAKFDQAEMNLSAEKRSLLEGKRAGIQQSFQVITATVSALTHGELARIETSKGTVSLNKGLTESLLNLFRKWEDMLHESRQKSAETSKSQLDLAGSFSSSFAHQSNPRG